MNTTLGELLVEAAQAFPDHIAVRSSDQEATFAELARAAGTLAASLRNVGFADGRVGILLPNGLLFPVALHALFRCGTGALLLNPANSRRELQEQLVDAAVRTVITLDPLRELLPEDVRSIELDDFPRILRSRIGAELTEIPLQPADPTAERFRAVGDEAVVIFTSAMAGRARGAILTHRNLVANLQATAEAMALNAEDRVFAALPFAHAFGLTVCLNAPLAVGGMVLPIPRFNPVAAIERIETSGATVLAGVPAMYIGLLNASGKRGVPKHSLRVALCGGAPLPLEVARQWEERFGIPLRQGYGLTEAAPVCLFNDVHRPNRIGTLGEPLPGVRVSIRDEAGIELAAGEVGELCVRGENVFLGYLGDSPADDPLATGFLRTGDLASIDDGVVRFRGTLKKMFTRNGFNVYPDEVRRALCAHELIADAVVLARPDLQRENEIVLIVIPRPGADLGQEDVRAICAA